MTRRSPELVVFAIGVIATAAVVAIGISDARTAARGWLYAFVLVSMAPVGSLGLLLVYGITGGRWGGDLAPVLVPLAKAVPVLFLAAIPIVALRHLIYDWPQHGIPPDVVRNYMNPPFFDARMIIALTIWTVLAWIEPWRSSLWSGLGFVAHIVCSTFIPADWVLSVQPGAASAGFGFGFAIEQMYAALAVAAILAPQGQDPRANRDLAGMLISAFLGAMYFIYVQFVIIWYGNIPDKIRWYATRSVGWWPTVAGMAFALGGLIPFLMLLSFQVRKSALWLRLVGILVAAGIALHLAWLTFPSLGTAAAFPGLFALIAIGCLMFFGFRFAAQHAEVRYGA